MSDNANRDYPVTHTPAKRAEISEKVRAYYATHEHPMKAKKFSPKARENMRKGQQAYWARVKEALARQE